MLKVRQLLLLLLVVLFACLAMLLLRVHQPAPKHYNSILWTTVVGVRREDAMEELLDILERDYLIAIRDIPPNSALVDYLVEGLPENYVRVLVAIYERDPVMNWGRGHLIYHLHDQRSLLKSEETLMLLKPDVIQSGRTAEILERIKKHDFMIVASLKTHLDRSIVEQLYRQHLQKPFFPSLLQYMTNGPILALILRQENAISQLRKFIGATDPLEARQDDPTSLRALYGQDKTVNSVHGSDSREAAAREIGLFCTHYVLKRE